MIRSLRLLLAGAALCGCAAATIPASHAADSAPTPSAPSAAAATKPTEKPSFEVAQQDLETSDANSWTVPLTIRNTTAGGVYLDSAYVEVESLDPGETRTPRLTKVSLPAFPRMMPSISAGESGTFDFQRPAIAEHARLTFRVHLKNFSGKGEWYAATAEVKPGPFARAHPSQFVSSGGKKVEYVLVNGEGDAPRKPALLLVHGHATHARMMLPSAQKLAARGYTVMVVSQPGYGQSEGPADLMGPATIQALAAALDVLERTPGVDSTRVLAWGVSRGATAVTALAARRPEIKGIVAQSGIYDLWATYRDTKLDAFRETIVAEAGKDSAAWRERSPVLAVDKLKCPVLVLHGESDVEVPPTQAHDFVNRLKQRGLPVESDFIPNVGHTLPVVEVTRATNEFLTRSIGS